MLNLNLFKKKLIISKNNLLFKEPLQVFFNNDIRFKENVDSSSFSKVNKFVLRSFKQNNIIIKFPIKVKSYNSIHEYNTSFKKIFRNNVVVKYKNLIINTKSQNILNPFFFLQIFENFKLILKFFRLLSVLS